MELTNKLRSLRTARGITQEALAEAMGVSAQAVSKWERGTTMPDVSLLPELAVYFGITLDELFGLTEEKEFDRIQNIIWDKRLLSHAEFDQAERWIDEKIASGYRAAECHRLKADLFNHQANFLKEAAAEEAKASLALDPDSKEAFGELNDAMRGFIPDWCVRNHYKLINYLKDFVSKHPDNWRAYLWLMDNLLDDRRFPEAEEALLDFEKCNDTYRVPFYRGLILWYQGKMDEAHAVWDQMEKDFADEWCLNLNMADVAAMELRYEDAASYYRQAVELQKSPKFVDGLESIAMVYEITGDYDKAIAAFEEELELLKNDWDTTEGETADSVRREIKRLKSKK